MLLHCQLASHQAMHHRASQVLGPYSKQLGKVASAVLPADMKRTMVPCAISQQLVAKATSGLPADWERRMQGRCNSDPDQRSVTIMITDACPECEADHIDVQALTFLKVQSPLHLGALVAWV